MKRVSRIARIAAFFSTTGLILALVFFCISLTPSLLPRIYVVQGVLSGVVFAAGYGIGRAGYWVWKFMEFRDMTGRLARIVTWILVVSLTLTAIYTLSRMTTWQNSIRLRMEMAPIDQAYPVAVLFVAIGTALVVILLVRLLMSAASWAVGVINRCLPHRISIVLGGTVFVLLLLSFVNGVILKAALHAMDKSFAAMNRLLDDDYDPPQDDKASGSALSLITTLLLLATIPLSAAAAEGPGEASDPQEGEERNASNGFDTSNLETPVFPDYSLGDAFRLRFQSRFLPAASFNDLDADLYQPSFRIQATAPVSQRSVLQLSGRFAASIYDFDGTSDFLGGGLIGPYPFDEFFRASLSLQGAVALNEGGGLFVERETWSILANAFGRSRWETGSFVDGLTGGGSIALGYEIEKLIRVAVGVSLESRLDRSGVGVNRIIDLRWNVTDRITLRNRGRGLQLEYDVRPGLEIFTAGFIENDKVLLRQRAGLPDDLTFRDEAVQVGAGFEWKISEHFRLNTEAGAVVKRKLRVKSRALGTLWSEEGDPSAYLEFRVEVRP